MKDNRLIAKFMGLTNHHNDNSMMIRKTPQGNEVISIDKLKYHISWDWLMPCIEKIRTIPSYDRDKFGTKVIISGDKTTIKSGCCGDRKHSGLFFNKTLGGKFNTMEATYKSVVEFIKWYNKEK